MVTSLIVVALLGPGNLPETSAQTLKWQESYSTARKMGRQQQKPLAVFIGNGQTGWKNVADEGNLSEKAKKVLAERYICLYVDRTQPGGERLAKSFDVPSGSGLVLSTRDGKTQAFSHTGKLKTSTIEDRLVKYAGVTDIARTEMLVDHRVNPVYNPVSSSSPTSSYPSNPISYSGPTSSYTSNPLSSISPTSSYNAPTMQNYASPSNFGGYSGGYSGGSSGGSSSASANC